MTELQKETVSGGIKKISISITSELDDALSVMCLRTGLNRSRVIENLLRSNKSVSQYLEAIEYEHTNKFVSGVYAAKSSHPVQETPAVEMVNVRGGARDGNRKLPPP